ncbi:MAG: arsenite methyltransferase [Candidatus Aminicenantes bacterium]|nr:arsenite methyltransferase [Candidatus Aminicenantes bacterium]
MKENIQKEVKKKYGSIAAASGSCCGSAKSGCCGSVPSAEELSASVGYSAADLTVIPEGANLGLGCGNPVALASLRPGETVLDLGSGGGIDCFLAARRVGPEGRVIGVDMTEEMIRLARENAEKSGLKNVEFRQGEIENLPVEDGTVDAVISNCVINLSPDKERVFREVYRVLKPGGRLMVSDIVLDGELSQRVRESTAAYTGCIGGALPRQEYLAAMTKAGFSEVEIVAESGVPVDLWADFPEEAASLSRQEIMAALAAIASIKVSARK